MKPAILYTISALLFCFFLGYIDEGYYSLKTFESFGNIIVLLMYALLFWAVQMSIHWLLGKIPGISLSGRKTLSVIIGLLLPLVVVMSLASLWNLQ